jgi:hypothetical protein
MYSKSTTKSWMALLVFLGAVTIGCTSETADISEKPSAPDASKKAAPDKPATAGTMKTSPSEETKTSAPSEEKDNTPAEPIAAEKFPKPDGAEKPMYTSDTSTILFHQKGTVEEQAKFYTEELGKLGWKKESTSEIADGVGWFDFKKGSLAITVTINPGREDGNITTIAQGTGLSVPESLEQDDDDDVGDEGQ